MLLYKFAIQLAQEIFEIGNEKGPYGLFSKWI